MTTTPNSGREERAIEFEREGRTWRLRSETWDATNDTDSASYDAEARDLIAALSSNAELRAEVLATVDDGIAIRSAVAKCEEALRLLGELRAASSGMSSLAQAADKRAEAAEAELERVKAELKLERAQLNSLKFDTTCLASFLLKSVPEQFGATIWPLAEKHSAGVSGKRGGVSWVPAQPAQPPLRFGGYRIAHDDPDD